MRKIMSLLLAGLMMAALLLTGCASGDGAGNADTKDEAENASAVQKKVPLAAYCYDADGKMTWQTVYRYNEAGQVSQEITSGYRMTMEDPYLYDYTYDDAGRLVKKTWSNAPGGYPGEEALERSYDASGNLTEESYLGMIDQWTTAKYAYDADGHLSGEELAIFGTSAYSATYEQDADGGYRVIKQSLDYPEQEPIVLQYDADGRLIRGWDDYWGVPIAYTYYDDPCFVVRDELTVADPADPNMTMERRYAYLVDSAGREIDSIPLGITLKATLHNDEDGFLTGVTSYDCDAVVETTEIVYGAPDEVIEWKDGSGEAVTPASPTAEANAPEWSEAYRAFVMNGAYLTTGTESYFADEEQSCALYDLDADGTPELLITSGSGPRASAGSYAYTFSGGSVRSLGYIDNYLSAVYASPDRAFPGLFTQHGGNTGIYGYSYYTVSDGAVQPELVMTATWASGNEYDYERCTGNDALYNVCMELYATDSGRAPITHFTVQEIQTMGWDAFVKAY